MNLRNRENHGSSLQHMGWMAGRISPLPPVEGEAFFLTSPFIERACVPLAGQLMALSKPTLAGHQRPLPPQSNSLTAFHRTVVSRRVPVAGAKGPFETTVHAVWSTTFIRSSFIRPPYTSILERAVSISRRSAGVS